MPKFKLIHEDTKREFGVINFNGNFEFWLNPTVELKTWQYVGLIPVDPDTRHYVAEDLFPLLNSRLPIDLRNASREKKIAYMKANGLRVASDSFYLEPVR
jgi:hypothetical protein